MTMNLIEVLPNETIQRSLFIFRLMGNQEILPGAMSLPVTVINFILVNDNYFKNAVIGEGGGKEGFFSEISSLRKSIREKFQRNESDIFFLIRGCGFFTFEYFRVVATYFRRKKKRKGKAH